MLFYLESSWHAGCQGFQRTLTTVASILSFNSATWNFQWVVMVNYLVCEHATIKPMTELSVMPTEVQSEIEWDLLSYKCIFKLVQLKSKREKNSGSNGIQTHDLCDSCGNALPLNNKATGSWSIMSSIYTYQVMKWWWWIYEIIHICELQWK